MKRLLIVIAIYLLLFPAVVILTGVIRGLILQPPGPTWEGLNLTWPPVVAIFYIVLAPAAVVIALFQFFLDRVTFGFMPLLVAIASVVACEITFRDFGSDVFAGIPNLDFFVVMAGLTCCLIANRLDLRRS
ncbi:hypothetical protein JQ581_18290 [Bradyrhizobium liaoningense]|uniref:hypothetical protein n=1 Tax=Bradyrhizobium liaoningense TaxID=43992 RepID=UPI001BAC98CC|nr:hypothetical protein [Bradyrhizobium liaoningense]MBR0738888.1 hypothetical protein [Bradyrhizobium liaoningense]